MKDALTSNGEKISSFLNDAQIQMIDKFLTEYQISEMSKQDILDLFEPAQTTLQTKL